MGAIEERKALEGLSRSWRRLMTGGRPPVPAAPPEGASPPTQTPVLPAQGGPAAPSTPGG